jgi:PAS domain S-box-containing protein
MEHHDVAPAAESDAARRQAFVTSFGARALAEGFDLDALLAEAAAHAAAGLRVERAKVLQHRPEANDLLVRAGVGWEPGVVGRAALPAGMASPPGRALRTGRAVALEDVRKAEGFEWSGLLRGHGVVSLLDVPVRLPGGAAWGVLEADAGAPRRFGREHEHFLLSLAGLLGAAIRRQEMEAALRDSEALKAAILEAALDCIVTIDQESRVVEWNPAAERAFGHPRAAALGADMAELIIPPELRGAHRRGLARYLATGEGPVLGRRVEVEALRADGSRFPAELAITPTSVGGRTLFTAHLRDITHRRAAERALAESEARFRAVADNIPQLAWMAEPDGRRVWFNQRWYDFTGLTPEQARGWGWRQAHHPEFLERALARMGRAWEAGEPWEDTFPLRGRDGEYRWFLTRAVPVRDAQGRVAHWFGTNTDVTAQPM